MLLPEDEKGTGVPAGGEQSASPQDSARNGEPPRTAAEDESVSYTQTTDDSYGSYHDGYPYEDNAPSHALTAPEPPAVPAPAPSRGGGGLVSPPPPPDSGEDDEEEGMMRMSFLEHLEELRSRIIKCILGIVAAMAISFTFCDPLWHVVVQPAKAALLANGFPPTLAQISPMEAFNVIWFKLPIVCAIFLASPWVVY